MDPRLVQKTIRIFLSSTFTDTRVDRNKLMEDVFEPVRDLCQQHGIAFEVVDLRWGKNAKSANSNDGVLGFKFSSLLLIDTYSFLLLKMDLVNVKFSCFIVNFHSRQ